MCQERQCSRHTILDAGTIATAIIHILWGIYFIIFGFFHLEYLNYSRYSGYHLSTLILLVGQGCKLISNLLGVIISFTIEF